MREKSQIFINEEEILWKNWIKIDLASMLQIIMLQNENKLGQTFFVVVVLGCSIPKVYRNILISTFVYLHRCCCQVNSVADHPNIWNDPMSRQIIKTSYLYKRFRKTAETVLVPNPFYEDIWSNCKKSTLQNTISKSNGLIMIR